MYDFSRLRKRARSITIGLAASGMVVGNVASVSALANSSLELSDPRSGPGITGVTYTFDTSSFSGNTARCVQLEFNDAADGGGSVPNNMVTTGAALDGASTMLTPGSWTLDATTNGTLELTNGTGEILANGNLIFDSITNGDTEGTTYYGIFTSYTDVSCTTADDDVIVAFTYKDGEPVQLTIDPTLTFTCSGVAASQAVGGGSSATTTHLSDANGINFLNDVTSSTNGVAAHDLNVTTNASGGYTVYIRHTGQLTNPNGDTIDNHTGTNAAPTNFPAAGTEAWGYHTADATLSASPTVDRFTDADDWAGFTTSNEEVMFNSAAATTTDTVRVANQVGVASSTEAGVYQTTIVYTAVATF